MTDEREDVQGVAARAEREVEVARLHFAIADLVQQFMGLNGKPATRRVLVDGSWVEAPRDVVDALRCEMLSRALKAKTEAKRLLGREVR